ncbi:type II toxin-antitoxin system PemK/MazF family toxin [Alysiella crassa]|uniref:Uncharacterized protein conserved in bacteria n=1 Tax=Alysiella crassa TaxID=153491 RepID=A0A376BKF7_9NEIS|nr:type II toxin-antitoxin system PemK/MazF family toxin [Alysiella crassa]UOP07641.1 type II toxin-antitoxin system PemK/MazF family toxin [Alysiella crassa]SSY70130.1 Uncharacterized protein conserved in bacteria [Alysiella crassa]
MPLHPSYFPKQSHILKCDFRGLIVPEMVKVRPVVIISPSSRHGSKLCTVVPLSTTAPNPAMAWHVKLSRNPNPLETETLEVWAKCNMIYTVSFERLDKFHRKTRNGREYLSPSMNSDDFSRVLSGVQSYLGFLTE